jgi:prepilin-type N-terminal cleavage/methylation domain-containing protein
MSRQYSSRRPPAGFTLVELLVVITILGLIGVIVIPSLRSLNEDRKIRDTARVVGAVFAAARERAAVDGQAGVEIVSIPSNPGGPARVPPEPLRYNVPNMGLILYQLRAIPPYIGDVAGAACTISSESNPLAPVGVRFDFAGVDFQTNRVRVGDFIELNGNRVKYGILFVSAPSEPVPFLVIEEISPPKPPYPQTAVPFKIYRQPVRIESTAVRLPNNLFLNMALSGYGPAPTTVPNTENQWLGRQFRDFQASEGQPTEGSTQFWFGSDGSLTYVRTRGYSPSASPNYFSAMQKPTGPVHLLMCNANNDAVDLTDLDSPVFLQDANNLWITINHRSGGVTMGRLAQINPLQSATNTLRTQIEDSRLLARNRRSATP